MRKSWLTFALIISLFFSLISNPAYGVETLPQPFFNYLNSKYLGDPGVILIDKATGEVIYESGSTKARTPASVLKLTSAVAIALTLDASTVFKTAIYKTEKRGVFVILGENDPWMTSSAKYRDANKRAFTPTLIKKAFASDKKLKKIIKKIKKKKMNIKNNMLRKIKNKYLKTKKNIEKKIRKNCQNKRKNIEKLIKKIK